MNEYKKIALLLLFTSYFTKTLIHFNSLVDAVILAVLGTIYCFSEYKASYKQLKELEKKVVLQETQIKDLQEKVTSIKFVQQVKPQSLGLK